MNSIHILTNSPRLTPNGHLRLYPPISSSIRRRNALKKPHHYHPQHNNKPSPDPKLHLVIDLHCLSDRAQILLNRLVSSGADAIDDLRTLVAVDRTSRSVVIACRPSTLRFVGGFVLWSLVVVFGFRVLVRLGLRLRREFGFGSGRGVVVRRDRSLGGKEVVVGRAEESEWRMRNHSRVLGSPLSVVSGMGVNGGDWSRGRSRTEKELPKWWPVTLPPPLEVFDKQEYQREANRLIREVMANRMSGKDILEDDMIQLRRICRTSGARASIDTANARDSFYRTSVEFVINICSRASGHSTSVEIDGEDARQFIAGLADNLGLENTRAARIVSAAVAARTRSRFLQAWALEMQGRHSEAVVELSKICLIHQIFPPEESSPEMEMVARGLEKQLKYEQREFLMNMLLVGCGEECHRSAAEALGLVHPHVTTFLC
ncbi:hypothetical protein PVL29_006646 [Vitis rotundifolia]|uniref:Uncharacterized protein n=1 Tax=Vitis rotundifolia TaxID=103349 RepID=A0AA39A7P5_VITRO|nr:hypothetical protein PVL29_006646 [Vitis rotundifolia]